MLTVDKKNAICLAYQLMKIASAQYSTTPDKLNQEQLKKLHQQVQLSSKMMRAVLASDEAADEKITAHEVNLIVTHLSQQCASKKEFETALLSQGLTIETVREAIYQDLLCEKTIHKQGLQHEKVSSQQVAYYYHKNREKFHHPERRKVSHILITINDQYPENRREQAVARLAELENLLQDNIHQFAELALQHSECPTALNGGLIGSVERGLLHAQLDEALFSMKTGELSGQIESETGLHLIYCSEITPKGDQSEQDALQEIRTQMNLHRAKKKQKLWINSLLKG